MRSFLQCDGSGRRITGIIRWAYGIRSTLCVVIPNIADGFASSCCGRSLQCGAATLTYYIISSNSDIRSGGLHHLHFDIFRVAACAAVTNGSGNHYAIGVDSCRQGVGSIEALRGSHFSIGGIFP